mgnify:CR=1 FL=1
MKFYSIDPNVDVVETPVEEQGRLIRHLHLAKGKQIPEHSADALVTVVCLEGKVDFTANTVAKNENGFNIELSYCEVLKITA